MATSWSETSEPSTTWQPETVERRKRYGKHRYGIGKYGQGLALDSRTDFTEVVVDG